MPPKKRALQDADANGDRASKRSSTGSKRSEKADDENESDKPQEHDSDNDAKEGTPQGVSEILSVLRLVSNIVSTTSETWTRSPTSVYRVLIGTIRMVPRQIAKTTITMMTRTHQTMASQTTAACSRNHLRSILSGSGL